jgi:hypothetical protein
MMSISNEEERSFKNKARGFAKSKLNHSRVDVYGVHALGMKILTYKSRAKTTSAADFKTAAPFRHGSYPFEIASLQALDKPSHRAVYPHSFRPVDFHSVFRTPLLSTP